MEKGGEQSIPVHVLHADNEFVSLYRISFIAVSAAGLKSLMLCAKISDLLDTSANRWLFLIVNFVNALRYCWL